MKNQEKTLVLLTPGFAESENDTTCLPWLQTLVRAWNRNNTDVKIIILAFQYPFFRKTYLWRNNQVIGFNGYRKHNINRLIVWMDAWLTLIRLKKENKIIGLFSFWITECALIGKYFGRYSGIKHMSWILGQDALKDNKYVKYIRPVPQELVAMSDFLAHEFNKNHGIKPGYVVVDGPDPEMFSGKPVAKDIHVFGAGNLIPLKQYEVFIDVVNMIYSRIPDFKSQLCGKGPEEDRLLEILSGYGLNDHLQLAGEIQHAEVIKLMERSRVFLHPSKYEGFGTVCAEALYAGAHVISFCKPMDAEIKHWHIVADKYEMAEKVYEILQDPATEYGSVYIKTMDEIAAEIIHLFNPEFC
jgi:glycosyltransferase involved in cell wall biosynthesis